MIGGMGSTAREQERKIEEILRQLEKLDQSRRHAERKLQQFTERLFGCKHKIEMNKQPFPDEAVNMYETILWRVRNVIATITSISFEIDSMIRELPEQPETERKR